MGLGCQVPARRMEPDPESLWDSPSPRSVLGAHPTSSKAPKFPYFTFPPNPSPAIPRFSGWRRIFFPGSYLRTARPAILPVAVPPFLPASQA